MKKKPTSPLRHNESEDLVPLTDKLYTEFLTTSLLFALVRKNLVIVQILIVHHAIPQKIAHAMAQIAMRAMEMLVVMILVHVTL